MWFTPLYRQIHKQYVCMGSLYRMQTVQICSIRIAAEEKKLIWNVWFHLCAGGKKFDENRRQHLFRIPGIQSEIEYRFRMHWTEQLENLSTFFPVLCLSLYYLSSDFLGFFLSFFLLSNALCASPNITFCSVVVVIFARRFVEIGRFIRLSYHDCLVGEENTHRKFHRTRGLRKRINNNKNDTFFRIKYLECLCSGYKYSGFLLLLNFLSIETVLCTYEYTASSDHIICYHCLRSYQMD